MKKLKVTTTNVRDINKETTAAVTAQWNFGSVVRTSNNYNESVSVGDASEQQQQCY